MDKNELKQLLDSYAYDVQYLREKSQEIEFINKLKNEGDAEVINQTLEQEKDKLKKIMNKKKNIENLFDSLSQPYHTVMYLRYIRAQNFDQIAYKLDYSTKRIYQLHSEAINKILSKINNNETEINK